MIKKETMLKYLPNTFAVENEIRPERTEIINAAAIKNGKVICLLTREFRVEDNFVLNFAVKKAREKKSDLKILFLIPKYEVAEKNNFFQKQFHSAINNFTKNGYKFEIFDSKESLEKHLEEYSAGLLIKDFNPIKKLHRFSKKLAVIEVDSHNIVPAKYASDKQEFNAASLRRKIYYKIADFLNDFPKVKFKKTEAHTVLEDFIKNKLENYAELKNNPNEVMTSHLSRYLHHGFISAQRTALEVIKSSAPNEDKEVFLEELIVRKELSDNFCFYNKKFKTFDGIPNWAKETLKKHSDDLRAQIYTLEEFEKAQTYDDLWNASQKQLLKEGEIHGYLRMYWAKKILDWSKTPENALKTAIYLNDKYGYDSPDPNGYVGILWSIGGLHDRAFQERPVSGKIRPMTYNGAKAKFDVQEYINHYL